MHAELLQIGALLLLAGLLARGARRVGLPTVPCFMLVGILFGPGTPGPVLIEHPEDLELLAAIGLVLLLFHLGVEFPVEQVLGGGRWLLIASGCYIGLNITAGFIFGLTLGWGLAEALIIAGAMGISSSAIATKLLIELRRLTNAETPVILGIIVIEDLFLAFYLALLQPVLSEPETPLEMVTGIGISFGFLLLLFALARYGAHLIGALLGSREDELLAILMVGLVALMAGLSEGLGVSEAIGALLIGLVVSRSSVKERVERLVLPLRDVFAAVFFVTFGLTIDVAGLAEVALPVLAAALVTLVANSIAGIVAGRLYGFNQQASANIGLSLLGRGEFSLILATLALAAGMDERIGPFVALYVLLLAILSPVVASQSRYLARIVPDRLMASGWRYVRGETMSTACTHLDQITDVEPGERVCAECVASNDPWVELRICLTCGNIGCCDDSVNRHATAHYHESGHPIMESLEPGEAWRYCFVDRILVREPLGRQAEEGSQT